MKTTEAGAVWGGNEFEMLVKSLSTEVLSIFEGVNL